MSTSIGGDVAICIVDNHAGVYIPQEFAEAYHNSPDCLNVSKREWDVLLSGPENEEYWEVWDRVVSNAVVLLNGRQYTLFPNMDLWLIRDPENEDEEEALADLIS